MKYIVFKELPDELPLGVSPIAHNAEGNLVFRLADGAEIPNGATEATNEEVTASADAVNTLKREIEVAADGFHKRFLGAETSRREQRFRENREMALEVQSGTATDETKAALQMQADAQARKSGDPNATMNLDDFVGWIIAWTPQSRQIAAAIEAFIVDAKSAVDSLENGVDPLVRGQFVRSLKEQAEAQFAALAAQQ